MTAISSGVFVSPLGIIHLMASVTGLTNIWFEEQKYAPVLRTVPENAIIRLGIGWLEAYFAGAKPDIGELPLDPQGAAFRQRIWNLVKEVPYGVTATYGEIAKRAASSPRAVGSAIARNPLILIVPCHRIIGSNNTLTGYAAGLERKAWLLAHEAAL